MTGFDPPSLSSGPTFSPPAFFRCRSLDFCFALLLFIFFDRGGPPPPPSAPSCPFSFVPFLALCRAAEMIVPRCDEEPCSGVPLIICVLMFGCCYALGLGGGGGIEREGLRWVGCGGESPRFCLLSGTGRVGSLAGFRSALAATALDGGGRRAPCSFFTLLLLPIIFFVCGRRVPVRRI